MSATITIELTDEQVRRLRDVAAMKGRPGVQTSWLDELAAAALPPEPVRITIEMDRQTKLDGAWFPGEHVLTLSECNVLRAASVALKREAFADAMSDGLRQSKAQGVPLT